MLCPATIHQAQTGAGPPYASSHYY